MSKKVNDPIHVAFSRFRLEWAKLWAEVGYSLVRWASKEISKHSRVIGEWEQELKEWES